VSKKPKKKKQKNKPLAPRPAPPKEPPIRTNQAGILRRIPPIGKAAIGIAVTLFSVWTAYIATVKPRVRIDPPADSVDPRNPYDAPFSLINDGYLSVYTVIVDCKPAVVAGTGIKPASAEAPWSIQGAATNRVLTLGELVANDHKPFVCDTFRNIETPNMKLDGVELQVTVTVSPLSFPNWPYVKSVLFEADSDGTSKFKWHELAIGEQPHFPKSSMKMRFSD
jgi:hypothetical protein